MCFCDDPDAMNAQQRRELQARVQFKQSNEPGIRISGRFYSGDQPQQMSNADLLPEWAKVQPAGVKEKDIDEQMKQLEDFLKAGALTQGEFEDAKQALLQSAAKSPEEQSMSREDSSSNSDGSTRRAAYKSIRRIRSDKSLPKNNEKPENDQPKLDQVQEEEEGEEEEEQPIESEEEEEEEEEVRHVENDDDVDREMSDESASTKSSKRNSSSSSKRHSKEILTRVASFDSDKLADVDDVESISDSSSGSDSDSE